MIEPVSRADNPRIAEYAHVGEAAWLRAKGLFVAEGRLVVARVVEERRFRVRSILVTHAALDAMRTLVEGARCPVYVAAQPLLNQVAGFNFHRGCLALAERPAADPPLEEFERARLLVALEGVGNPDNVGGIFRNALAFGAGGVLLDPTSGDPLYRKAVRTSMAATLTVPFARVEPWPRSLDRFRRAGVEIVALTPDPAVQSIWELPVPDATRLMLLLGSEGPGLTPEALDTADVQVRIPIAPGVDSLNVTVAAGVALAAFQNFAGAFGANARAGHPSKNL